MLKLKNKAGAEYEVLGHVTFLNEEEVEQTNYTIVIGEETVTVESINQEWELIEVEEVIPEPEVIIEEVVPEPEVIKPIELTEEEIARNIWLEKWAIYKQAKRGMEELTAAGFEPTPEESARFTVLKEWLGENRKIEYTMFI